MEKQPWFVRFQDRLATVEAEMRASLPAEPRPLVAPFYGMMAYHLGWRDASFRPVQERAGKRLRPLLCLLACEVAGEEWEKAVPAAAAVELTHNFTLIHDDIEDASPLRRGRPTLWKLWGIPQAINVGDGMFVVAQAALLRLRDLGLPPDIVVRAVQIFNRAILSLCEGQYLDLSFEGRLDVDETAYIEMIAGKTAALLEASLHLGAVVGQAGPAAEAALVSFGHDLGLAFQIQDDLLGVWGEEAITGKPAAADIAGRKLGMPVVHGLIHASGADREALRGIYQGSGPLGKKEVQEVLRILDRYGSRAYLEEAAVRYHVKALEALHHLPAGPAMEALEEIAQSLVGRSE